MTAANEMNSWRPFETAPETMADILVYRPDAEIFIAANHADENTGENCWFSDSGEDLTNDLPTHWMPLPQFPKLRIENE